MPINPSQNAVYEVALEGVWDGAIEMRNVFHMQKVDSGVITEGQFLDDMEEYLEAILAIIKTIQATIMIWNGLTVATVEGPPQSATRSFGSPIAGEVSGAVLPSGVAVLSYMGTGYRRRQLRKYWGGMPEQATASANGEWGSGTLGVIADVQNLLLLDFDAANGTWRYGGYNTAMTPEFVFPTQAEAQSIVSYQRRRRRGRGI